jgi:pimeloyl-ACP methyl ester carboxylesterase
MLPRGAVAEGIFVLRLILSLICLVMASTAAFAEEAVFTYLKTVPAAELTRMLDEERATFIASQKAGEGYQLPPVSRAANDVELYTVSYPSQVPERGFKPITATGLLALPVLADRSRLPLIIYEHGTVYGKYEVPSYAFVDSNPSDYPHYDGSYETRYMAGLFAGNGYALIAPDYFGMGGSAAEPEAYFVKGSTQRAGEDLYLAAQRFLASKGIAQTKLFIGGWSQGGLNATGLQERLEEDAIPVTATFTASAPADPYAALNGLLFYPRPGVDAPWVNTIMALSLFAFQNYYGPADLAQQTLDPSVYEDMKAIYERSYKGQEGLKEIMARNANRSLADYLRPELRDPVRFGVSAYGRLLASNETYRQSFGAPIHMYFGSVDEAVKPMIGMLAAAYQAVLIGNLSDQSGNHVWPIDVKGGTHRLTFIAAAPAALQWMDGLQK